MKNTHRLSPFLLAFILLSFVVVTPEFANFFDNGENSPQNIIIEFDSTDSTNIWQIGKPQKEKFNMSASLPNALVTDTLNVLPLNDTSSFLFEQKSQDYIDEILAVQWLQKLDFDFEKDGGFLEVSLDGINWENIFTANYIYNFFGYDQSNVGVMSNGEMAFTGIDTTWKNVWVCLDTYSVDSMFFQMRFTSVSDSIDNNNDGWMIDNLIIQNTFIHTISDLDNQSAFNVLPNPTKGMVEINLLNLEENDVVQGLELMDSNGRILDKWEDFESRSALDLSQYPSGVYYFRLVTKKGRFFQQVMLQH